jgi:hypothetical protein
MEKTVSFKHLVYFALGVIALVLVSGYYTGTKGGRDVPVTTNGHSESDGIPGVRAGGKFWTMTEVEAVGGFANCPPTVQQAIRAKYIHDLRGLLKRVEQRRVTYIARGQEGHARECENAMSLLHDAIHQASQPASDPTYQQGLINDVNEALQR